MTFVALVFCFLRTPLLVLLCGGEMSMPSTEVGSACRKHIVPVKSGSLYSYIFLYLVSKRSHNDVIGDQPQWMDLFHQDVGRDHVEVDELLRNGQSHVEPFPETEFSPVLPGSFPGPLQGCCW